MAADTRRMLGIALSAALFAVQGTQAADLRAATDAAIRAAIQSPTLFGYWLIKPQYAVSRDGKRAVYAIQTADIAANGYTLTLWVKNLESSAPPRLVADLRKGSTGGEQNKSHMISSDPNQPINPSFSPDGSKVAIVATGAAGDLAIVDIATGAVQILHPQAGRVSENGNPHFEDVEWSPDGKKLAVTFAEVEQGDSNKGTEVTVDWNGSLTRQISRLAVIDLASNSFYAVTPDKLDVMGFSGAFSWSPDSTRIAFSAQRVGDSTYDFMWTDIFALDVESQAVRPLVAQNGRDLDPHWSPDGRSIAFLSDGGVFGWGKGLKAGIYSVSQNRSRYFPQSDETTNSAFAQTWYDGGHILFVGLKHMSCPLFEGSIDDLSLRQVTPDNLSCVGGTFAAAGGTIVTGNHSFANSSVLVRSPIQDWKPVPIAPDAPQGLPAASEKVVSWPSADGRYTIHGVLITPNDGKSGRRPLLVTINGGPSMVTSDLYDASAQQLIYPALLRGYAILAPNTRGRGGYGEDFADGIRKYHDVTPGPFSDVMTGVDYVVNDLKIADSAHMVLMGFSYGGLLSSYAASHTDRFKAIIEGEGSGDFRDFAAQSFGSIEQIGYRSLFGISDPYDPAEAKSFADQSPFTHAADIRTPLMIECGSESLARTECLKFFRIVKAKSAAPATMIVYPRTGHGIFEPALRYDAAMRETDWIDHWNGVP